MANTVTSPNMSLSVPVPSTAPGPLWAQAIYSCLYGGVDQHNHSLGQGVQIQPSGLNINSNLTFNNNSATYLQTTTYQDQGSSLSSSFLGAVYVAGGNLYFNAGMDGFAVQITNGHSVNGSSGTISGLPSGTASASYSAGTFVFQSATSTPANIDGGSVLIRNILANSKAVTLSAAPALAANYPLVLPAALPAAQSFVTLDASGNVATGVAYASGITTAQLADNAVTTPKIADNAVTPAKLSAYNASSVAFSTTSTTSTSAVAVTGATTSLTMSGLRPLMVILEPRSTNVAGGVEITNANTSASGFVQVVVGSSVFLFPYANIGGFAISNTTKMPFPPPIISFPTAGSVTVTVNIIAVTVTGTTTIQMDQGILTLIEI